MKRFAFTVALILASRGAIGSQTRPLSPGEVNELITYFYTSPDQSRFELIQAGLSDNLDLFSDFDNGVGTLVSVFLARAREKHGWPIADIGALDDVAHEIVENADNEFVRAVNSPAVDHTIKLDIWWASFFATGETRYLDNLLRYVGDPESPQFDRSPVHREDMDRVRIAEAVNSGFRSNSRQHPAVLQYARAQAALNPPVPNREFLIRMIEDVEERGG